MQSQEQKLIEDLYNRLKANKLLKKDNDANVFIQETIANEPDVIYRLVQVILLQQLALQKVQQNIKKTQVEHEDQRNFLQQENAESSFLFSNFNEAIKLIGNIIQSYDIEIIKHLHTDDNPSKKNIFNNNKAIEYFNCWGIEGFGLWPP